MTMLVLPLLQRLVWKTMICIKHLYLKNRRNDVIDSHGTLIDKHGDNYTKSCDMISLNVRVTVFFDRNDELSVVMGRLLQWLLEEAESENMNAINNELLSSWVDRCQVSPLYLCFQWLR